MKGNKMLATVVAILMVMSTLVVLNNVTDFKLVGNASATTVTLSDDGSRAVGGNALGLYPGQQIEFKVSDCSLNASQKYYVKVWHGDGWNNLKVVSPTDQKSDKYGNLNLVIRVPGWTELNNTNPLSNGSGLGDGKWNIGLFDNSETKIAGTNTTITISNLYEVRYKVASEDIDHILYMKDYLSDTLEVYVYNWTGSGNDLSLLDDESLSISIHKFNGEEKHKHSSVTGGFAEFAINESFYGSDSGNFEYYMWLNVSNEGFSNQNYSNFTLPVKLDVTTTLPTSVTWGQTSKFTVRADVFDGDVNAVGGYTIAVYSPVDGGYSLVKSGTTQVNGRCSLEINPATDMLSAGTWYVGTRKTGGTYRIDETDVLDIANFIQYGSFEVSSRDAPTVTIRNKDDIVKGFTQTINVSVANSTSASWDDDVFQNMNIHITGIKVNFSGVEYARTDKVLVKAGGGTTGDKISYYTFSIMFLETGTGTIEVSWPGNQTTVAKTSTVAGETGTYSAKYGNDDLKANVTGSTTFSVVSPGTMSVFVDNPPEAVQVKSQCGGLINKSASDGFWTNISVFGDSGNSHKNATIKVTGCGLDFIINESDATHDNLLDYGFDDTGNGAWYNVSIIPKRAGTLTITVTNGTSSVVKDYAVAGLTGSVTTSIGDDLEITVGTIETITVTPQYGVEEVTIIYVDEDWSCISLLNDTRGDSGVFSFTPEIEDDEWKIGYMVVVAGITGIGQYLYDIIEVVPIEDLEIEVVTPDVGNQTLTVGIEDQEIVIKLLDDNEDPVTEDSPGIQCRLIDDDHDWDNYLQEFTFTPAIEDGEWEAQIHPWFAGQLVIKGHNASEGIKHIGQTIINVEHATITYSPAYTTAGIGIENLTVEVTGVDANGNPLAGVTLYLWEEDDSGDLDFDASVTLDEDGAGEFDIAVVGDLKTHINATLVDGSEPADGNRTIGEFNIYFPTFVLNPDTIYTGQSNSVGITTTDAEGNAIEGIYLTFVSSIPGILAAQPDPVLTDEDGFAEISMSPLASGKLNVTIARNVKYVGGQLNWTNAVITDSYVTATSIKRMSLSVSKSPIYQGETLTVTATTYGTDNPLSGVDVEFAGTTNKTGTNGQATFTVPDPGVESATYTVTGEKAGYISAERTITVIKVYAISIVTPDEVFAGESFTVTIIAKGQVLAGATVTLDGTTEKISGGDGKVTFTAGAAETTHTITATYGNYNEGTATVVVEAGTPGFELLTLIVAIGIAFILLKKRRNK